MKNVKQSVSLFVLMMFTLLSFGQKLTYDQSVNYKSSDPEDWPVELESIISAPKNHKVLMENDKVRVLEVTILPGEQENLHCHKYPSVLHFKEAEDFIDSDAEGNVIFDTRTLPSHLKLPMTMWKDAEAPHKITNLSRTKSIKIIRVEMKI